MSEKSALERPAVLMLAAGEGRRFGRDKRQTPVYEGATLLVRSVESFRRAGLDLIVCLADRDRDAVMADALRGPGVAVVFCDRAAEGMGATLAQGAHHCNSYPGVFVALADMPAIAARTLQGLEKHLRRDAIVFPQFEGRRGHPVLFGSRFFSELRGLSGDRGAASVIADNQARCRVVEVDDPGVILDVDTPDDVSAVSAVLQRRSSSGVSG